MNKVFIATSLDGYIADKAGGIDWLETFPEINTIDTGYQSFIATIDALVMGRATYEKVLSFGIEWPYKKPVYVLSNSLSSVPQNMKGKVHLLSGTNNEILSSIHKNGHKNLYIDGGQVIQNFLKEDLIDEMIITVIPVLLGHGIRLFGKLSDSLEFHCVSTTLYLDKIAQHHYIRNRG